MKLSLQVLVGYVLWLMAGVAAKDPSVLTPMGRINGALCSDDNSVVASYLGIPYAQPPIGNLRWAAPVQYTKLYPATGLKATVPGPVCRQGAEGDENCLYLNVWAPVNATSLRYRLPVRVFIHGGGFQTGSGSDTAYDGCKLVSDGNVVFVTINYRLGALGFLALPELRDPKASRTVGNWGLLDQRLALRWIKNNIYAFGGDASRVLLTGESAGAYSTLMHMVMPWSRALFSAAVSFSGSADAMAVDFLGDAYAKGGAIREALNCSATAAAARGYASSAACLRDTDADTILAVQAALCVETVQFPLPTIDGVVLPKHPVTLMEEGASARVPILLGVNANEGALEVIAQTRDATNIDMPSFFWVVNNLIRVAPSFNTRLYEQYNADAWYGGNWIVSAIHAITDGGYHCPSRRAARAFAAQGLPTRYHILEASQPNSGCPAQAVTGVNLGQEIADFMGAFHSYDIPFSFMAPYRAPYNSCPFTAGEAQLASFLSGITNSMAATGQPLPPRSKSLTSPIFKGVTSWPTWNATQQLVMDIDTTTPQLLSSEDILLDLKCQLWDDILASDIAARTSIHD